MGRYVLNSAAEWGVVTVNNGGDGYRALRLPTGIGRQPIPHRDPKPFLATTQLTIPIKSKHLANYDALVSTAISRRIWFRQSPYLYGQHQPSSQADVSALSETSGIR